jgi:hypothetical protein
MTGRLPAQLEASALDPPASKRRAAFGTILKRGDPDRGALILLIASGDGIIGLP